MITGSCLCGQVRFEIDDELRSARYCHCSNCRKFSGTSPAAWAMANAKKMKLSSQDMAGSFDSGRGIRRFCQTCGSPVWFESKEFPDIVGIPLGVLDSGVVPQPAMHLWTTSKPEWCVIHDGLTKLERGPDA